LPKKTFRAVLKNPHIVHFTTPEKPWHANSHHPFRAEFFRYLDRTDWAGWRPADDTSWPTWFKYQRTRLRTAKDNYKLRVIGRLRDVRDWVRGTKTVSL
jgi:lipopolysaccharide biosynthesis glycosyltransferase